MILSSCHSWSRTGWWIGCSMKWLLSSLVKCHVNVQCGEWMTRLELDAERKLDTLIEGWNMLFTEKKHVVEGAVTQQGHRAPSPIIIHLVQGACVNIYGCEVNVLLQKLLNLISWANEITWRVKGPMEMPLFLSSVLIWFNNWNWAMSSSETILQRVNPDLKNLSQCWTNPFSFSLKH